MRMYYHSTPADYSDLRIRSGNPQRRKVKIKLLRGAEKGIGS